MTSPESPQLSSALVCAAYHLCKENDFLAELVGRDHKEANLVFAYDVLAAWTGQDPPACWAAVETANKEGLLDYGTSLRAGWLTEAGVALLEQSGLDHEDLCIPTMLKIVNSMSTEEMQRLAEQLEKHEAGQAATAPRIPGPRH